MTTSDFSLDHNLSDQFESGEPAATCQGLCKDLHKTVLFVLPCKVDTFSGTVLNSQVELDTQGLICPEPLMLLRNRVREMKDGETVHILATDPSTHRDFSNFCRFMGHELLRAETDSEVLEFWIRKVAS